MLTLFKCKSNDTYYVGETRTKEFRQCIVRYLAPQFRKHRLSLTRKKRPRQVKLAIIGKPKKFIIFEYPKSCILQEVAEILFDLNKLKGLKKKQYLTKLFKGE